MPSSGVKTCALDRKSTRLNSSHTIISYAVFCLKKKKIGRDPNTRLAYPREPHRTQASRGGAPSDGEHETRAAAAPHAGLHRLSFFFFFNDTAPPEIYPLSLPDALPISSSRCCVAMRSSSSSVAMVDGPEAGLERSEEHTSELQSHDNLVCRLLLEK